MDYSFEIPPDTVIQDETNCLSLIKAINLCETEKKLLSTRVIDELLVPFKSNEVYICPTFNPNNRKQSPYYKKELEKLTEKQNRQK